MDSIRQTLSTIAKTILVAALALPLAVFVTGCHWKKTHGGQRDKESLVKPSLIGVLKDSALAEYQKNDHVREEDTENEDDWPLVPIPYDTLDKLFGKSRITSEAFVGELNDICNRQLRSPGADGLHRNSFDLERKFADDIFMSLDGVAVDTFALAVKELFDREALFECCRSFCGIREFCYGKDYPLPGSIKPSKVALEAAFTDSLFRKEAEYLLDLIYKKADFGNRFDYHFKKLKSLPRTFQMPFDTTRLGRALRNEDKYRDKSAFVPDIDRFRASWASYQISAEPMDDPIGEIVRRIDAGVDFDAKCIYACELASILDSIYARGILNVLGAVIESRQYSRFLFDVWSLWECRTQVDWFGCSGYSITPTSYFISIRSICANTTLRHLQAHPEDDDALLTLFRLIFNDQISANGWFYSLSVNRIASILNNPDASRR